jgi:phage terminase large subunit-like protein
MAMANDAMRMPAREAEFRNLVLNQRVEVYNPFVSRTAWYECGDIVGDLHGTQVYAGLDLSSVSDLTALVLIGRIGRVWHIKPTFWLPEEGLREKSKKDRTPYDLWHEQGYLQTTSGKSVSYEYVAEFLYQMFAEYDIQKLAFDDWGMIHLKPWLLKAGFSEQLIEERFHKFRQGGKTMAPALRDLEQAIREKEIAHGNHPVLAMCAACAVVDGKDDSTRRLSKNKSTGRIDGMVALAMAIGVAPLQGKAIDVEALIG